MSKFYMLILLGFMWNSCLAQTKNKHVENQNHYTKRGDYFFERYEFKQSISFYNKAIRRNSADNYALLRKAEAYSKLNKPLLAEQMYSLAIDSTYKVENEYLLKYALVLLSNEKFEKSKHYLSIYSLNVEEDIRADKYLNSIENRADYYKDSTINVVRNLAAINSKASDINPVLNDTKLIFTSSRNQLTDIVSNDYYDIYVADLTPEEEFINLSPLSSEINTAFHEGPIALTSDKASIYFTRNISKKVRGELINLGIYKSDLPFNDDKEVKPESVNIKGFTKSMGHPAINSDESFLYFISDSAIGIGGADIYRSEKIDNEWSYPENLGEEINTKGDEMFPYLSNDSILYFASDGHGGMGGLDLFKVNLTKSPLEIINLGYPINSNSDDFSISFIENSQGGYFSSNRKGGMGSDDIYEIDFVNFKVKVMLIDSEIRDPLETANLTIIFSNGEEYDIVKNEDGEYEFGILPGESYRLVVEKDDYLAEEVYFDKPVSASQREKIIIEMAPVKKAEILLDTDERYDFTSTSDTSSDVDLFNKVEFLLKTTKSNVDDTSKVTLLDKEVEFSKNDVYNFKLVRDHDVDDTEKKETVLFINNDSIPVDADSIWFEIRETDPPVESVKDALTDTVPAFKIEESPNLAGIDSGGETADIIFRVQIAASKRVINDKELKSIYGGDLPVKHFVEDGWNKYYVEDAPSYFEAKQVLNESGVNGAFIVSYTDGDKISLKEAMSIQYKERMKQNGLSISDSVLNIVTVNFGLDKFELRTDEQNYLQDLVIEELKTKPETYVTVNGHTDIQGGLGYNYALSEQRVMFVQKVLVEQGISLERIRTFSFGETQVLKACDIPESCDESVHKVNRRVEIILFTPN